MAKGKKGGKKGKGKKKGAVDDDAPKKRVLSMNEKDAQIDLVLMKRFDTTEPVEEYAPDRLTFDMEMTTAIELI